jgi:hypothetical protein
MKPFSGLLGIAFLSLTLCFVLPVSAQVTGDVTSPPAPTLTSPPNGDQLDTRNVRFQWDPVADESGVTYNIVVTDMDHGIILHEVSGINVASIDLLLYDAYYSWNVTATDGAGNVGPASGDWYILVVAIDHLAPDTVVTAPNGGEVLDGGSYFPITWYALDQDFTSTPDLKVKIFFSYDFGANWEQIADLQENLGAFAWYVPNIDCDEACLIRVVTENEAGLFGSDDSDFAFTIIYRTFADVPHDHFAFDHIEAIAAGGITGGCKADDPQTPINEALFCPDAPITRGQMAVFIETSLGHEWKGYTGWVFSDVNAASVGEAFCGYIEEFAADGFSAGCGNGMFCPNVPVTRGEMAVFLETALGNPPNQGAGRFTDVPADHPFYGFIERLADDGITAGCGAGKYCVNDPVTRAQMAVFLTTLPTPLSP